MEEQEKEGGAWLEWNAFARAGGQEWEGRFSARWPPAGFHLQPLGLRRAMMEAAS